MNADTGLLCIKINFPAVKIDYFLTQAAKDIITILANPPAPTVTNIETGDETNNYLLKLALLFDQTDGTNKIFPIQHKNKSTLRNKKWFQYQPHQFPWYHH